MADFIADASTDIVRVRSPQADRLARTLRAANATVRTLSETSIEVEGITSEEIGIAAAAEQVTLYELATQTASLEEAYMALTADSVDFRSSDGTPSVSASDGSKAAA